MSGKQSGNASAASRARQADQARRRRSHHFDMVHQLDLTAQQVDEARRQQLAGNRAAPRVRNYDTHELRGALRFLREAFGGQQVAVGDAYRIFHRRSSTLASPGSSVTRWPAASSGNRCQ